MAYRRGILAALVAALMAGTATAAVNGPVKAVTLSSGGLAEVIREADVSADREISIDVPLDQIDDVLKSLVVRDEKGAVKNLSLAGPNPLEETFRTLPFKPDDLTSMPRLLSSIKGTRIRAGEREGVILGVSETGSDEKQQVWQLSLMSDNGEIAMVELPGTKIEIVDPAMRDKLAKAIGVIAKGNADGARTVTVRLDGEGSRKVAISYVVPTPIWKTTYRLVTGDDGTVRLQAWAVFENASGEDWKDVAVTLSSGRPVTLRQNLHQHFWRQRTEVPVDNGFQRLQAPFPLALEDAVGGQAFGAAKREAERAMRPAAAPMAEASFEMARAEQADATEGDITSRFALNGTFDVPNGDTVSVPILDKGVKAEMVSLYSAGQASRFADAAAMIENTSGISLPAGILTVYDGKAGYVGDASLNGLPTGEERAVRFAADQKVSVTEEVDNGREITAITVSDGMIHAKSLIRDTTTYHVKGANDGERTVLIEIPKRDGSTFDGGDAAVKPTATDYRLKVTLAKGEEKALTGRFETVQEESFGLVDASAQDILNWQSAAADPDIKAKLETLAKARKDQADAQNQLAALDTEYERVSDDQVRVRGNLAVVSGGDTGARFDKLLNDLQTQLEEIETRRIELRKTIEDFNAQVGEIIRTF